MFSCESRNAVSQWLSPHCRMDIVAILITSARSDVEAPLSPQLIRVASRSTVITVNTLAAVCV